jgi:hypothetical protein
MNTLINKKNLMLLVLAAIFISPALAGEREEGKDNSNELNYEILDPFYNQDNANELVILEFYDHKDNLVYTTTIPEDDQCKAILAKYLNQSDFLAESGQTSYYRLNK